MKWVMLLCVLLIVTGRPAWGEEAPAAFHIKNVHHILLTVKELDASIHFYQDILGLSLVHRYKTFAMLNAGPMGVFLSTVPWPFDKQEAQKGAGIFPHFEIDNMDALIATLQKHHVTILQEPKSYSWGKECFARDPDGYQWSFVELPAQQQ